MESSQNFWFSVNFDTTIDSLTLFKNILPSKLRCGIGLPTILIDIILIENFQQIILGKIILSFPTVLFGPSGSFLIFTSTGGIEELLVKLTYGYNCACEDEIVSPHPL